MTVTAPNVIVDPSQTAGAMQEVTSRELAAGGVIEFEFAPYGWLTQDGAPRQRDHRAYYFTPAPECADCAGVGRVASEKRPGGTVKCQPCKGTGQHKRERLPSVTTLLDAILPKPGLPPWSEARGIEGAVRAMQLGLIGPETDPADAVKLVREARLGADRARDLAADRGLNIHALLEDYMLTGNVPSLADHPVEHYGFLQALCAFLLKHDPEPVAVEQLVCDPAAGYAGRRDLVAMVGGFRVGYDAKTQEDGGIYSSAHVQLQMYERAGIACGDEPCDRLDIVVFAANGDFRVMPCEAMPRTVDRALAFAEEMRPIDSRCASLNAAEKKARRG